MLVALQQKEDYPADYHDVRSSFKSSYTSNVTNAN